VTDHLKIDAVLGLGYAPYESDPAVWADILQKSR
jgi:hypothetical protein